MSKFLEQILHSDKNAPQSVWKHFEQFCVHPRPSKHEEKIKSYLKNFAESKKLRWREDAIGNIMIYVPASKGHENSQPVLIQNHIDMVTDALPDKVINFLQDSITPYVDGEWVKAKGTTLGADNGIGASLALSLIDHADKLKFPALELLFTVDEETGLTGALELDASMISANRMLNLDTEEWGALYIGCTGGMDIKYKAEFSVNKCDGTIFSINVSGLCGGHSGLDIHRERGNAICLLIDLLLQINQPLELISFEAGRAHNIIPRSASVSLAVKSAKESDLRSVFDAWVNYCHRILPEEDKKNFQAELKVEQGSYQALNAKLWDTSLKYFFQFFPHGAHKYVIQDGQHSPLVRLSNNLAKCSLKNGVLTAATSIRFFDQAEGERLKSRCLALGKQAGFSFEVRDGYPSWTPDFNSKFLARVASVYEKKFGHKPKIKAIHAGLECGIILAKKPGMQAVSIGPQIQGAHSPDEKVLISDVTKTWEFLTFVLADLVE